jgi:GNAT superfamily N-acetyltransferase
MDTMFGEAIVRAAEERDLPALLRLYAELVPEAPVLDAERAAASWKALLRFEGSAIFVAEAGSVPVSTCTLVVVPNLTRGGAPYALIENVVTAASHRRAGFGGRVLDHAVSAAWQCGCYKVMLMTGSKRPETLAFYERCGFERTKTGFERRRLPKRSE